MKKLLSRSLFAPFLALGVAGLTLAQGTAPAASAPQAPARPHSALEPVARAEDWWKARHDSIVARAKAGADLVFLGDSITQGWESEGKEAWAKHYGERHALNAGISGDRTQHVLWRLDHGLLDALASAERQPKLALVMIGTNNSNGSDNAAEEISDGIVAIVERVRAKLPATQVLLLAIFPRGVKPDAQREKNARASALAATALAGDKAVRALDIGPKFLEPDGTLTPEVMPDLLHLSPRAYETWAASIAPALDLLAPAQR